jgi:DNA-binding response OmpR family regulator
MARILVAAEDADVSMLIEMRIAALGHDAVTTPDCREALALLLEKKFDLLVAGNMLPTTSGAMLVRELRTLPGFATFPVIMVTGLDPNPHATGASVCVALGKPFSLRTLSEHVTRLLTTAPQAPTPLTEPAKNQ